MDKGTVVGVPPVSVSPPPPTHSDSPPPPPSSLIPTSRLSDYSYFQRLTKILTLGCTDNLYVKKVPQSFWLRSNTISRVNHVSHTKYPVSHLCHNHHLQRMSKAIMGLMGYNCEKKIAHYFYDRVPLYNVCGFSGFSGDLTWGLLA